MDSLVVRQNQTEAFEGNEGNQLCIQPVTTKYPQYAEFPKRLETFKHWPTHTGIRPYDLAEAGLVYTGVGDCVRCFWCGVGLREWEQGNNPLLEHAKYFSECPYVIQKRGSFINSLVDGDSGGEASRKEFQSGYESDQMNSPAALSCIYMGYDKEIVQTAINEHMKQTGCTSCRGVDIAQHCEKLMDRYGNSSKSASINIVADTIHTPLPNNEASTRGEGTELNNVCEELNDCHTINTVSENSTDNFINTHLSRSEFDNFHLGQELQSSHVLNYKQQKDWDIRNNMSFQNVGDSVHLSPPRCELVTQIEDTDDRRELENSNVPNNSSSTNTVAASIHESLPVFVDNGDVNALIEEHQCVVVIERAKTVVQRIYQYYCSWFR